MIRFFKTLFIAAAIISTASAETALIYEPAVVEVSGKITKGSAEHPNGTSFDFLAITLEKPASIAGDGEPDSINQPEKNVKEIQIFSVDPATRKKLGAMAGKRATLKGTIFHSHTAWHVRELVLNVTEVK